MNEWMDGWMDEWMDGWMNLVMNLGQAWGDEMLELCRSTELLIVSGRTREVVQGNILIPAHRGKV